MFKTLKISLLSLTLLFATTSSVFAKEETKSFEEEAKNLGLVQKVKRAVTPGNPIKIMDETMAKIFGKDTFAHKVASGSAPKIFGYFTTKALVTHIFDELKTKYVTKLNEDTLGKRLHKAKDVSGIIADTMLIVWLTNKSH